MGKRGQQSRHPAVGWIVLWQVLEQEGLANQLRHISDFQTPHQIEPVDFHRLHANLQLIRNFPAGVSLSDQVQDLLLTRRERRRRRRLAFRRSFLH